MEEITNKEQIYLLKEVEPLLINLRIGEIHTDLK